jgi:uncharacterized 2Fe-2S/4Fe-4S cluster protein (DUF4445 family)
MATVVFNGSEIEVREGESLFEAIRRAGLGQLIASSCPGTGECKECIVRVIAGGDAINEPREEEAFLQHHGDSDSAVHRLACQTRVNREDAVVRVETFKRRLDIATTGRPALDPFEPWITRDGREIRWNGISIAHYDGPIAGIAIDVGTTTVVMHVVDLDTGGTTHVRAFENPQRFGGSDVIHRISYDGHNHGQLHRTIIAYVNHEIEQLPIDPRSIMAITVAGNPTMRDLFFGIDVQPIGQYPFMSVTQMDMLAGRRESTALWAVADELGLNAHPQAPVYGLPLISNHVGADTAAVLATLPIEEHREPFMMIDIGTNSEVVIGHRDRLIAASCAAGPAFEGGRLSCGMAASDGAIARMRRNSGGWELELIGTGSPRGICGSGLVDLLAELRRTDEIDLLGRFQNGTRRISLSSSPPLFFSGNDASELAQTKAAIGLGQAVLLRRLGIAVADLQTYYLAGAFANRIDLGNAQRIGLLLPVPDDRVVRIGNASVEGAKAALRSRRCLDRIERLARRIEHVELEKEPDFFDLFAEMTQFQPITA